MPIPVESIIGQPLRFRQVGSESKKGITVLVSMLTQVGFWLLSNSCDLSCRGVCVCSSVCVCLCHVCKCVCRARQSKQMCYDSISHPFKFRPGDDMKPLVPILSD